MNIILLCLFLAMFLPLLSKMPVVIAMQRQGGYNNHYPRTQQASLTGFGARATAGHQNSFESLLFFAIASLTVVATHHESLLTETLAIFYLIARVVYHLLYLLNWATLRTLIWASSFLANVLMMGAAIF